MKLRLLFALLLFLLSSPAHSFVLTEFLAVNLSVPKLGSSLDPSMKSSPAFSLGFGISFGFRVLDRIDIEPGVAFMVRNFHRVSSNLPDTDFGLATVQIPLLIRYWITDNYSVGAGPYFARGIGKLTQTQNRRAEIVSYNDLGWANSDLGFQTSFRYRAYLGLLMSVILDGRLAFGLTDIEKSDTKNLQFREIQTWCGIAFVL